MRRAAEILSIGACLVLFWALIFALLLGSPIVSTILSWLMVYGLFAILLLLFHALEFFEIKRDKMLNEKEK